LKIPGFQSVSVFNGIAIVFLVHGHFGAAHRACLSAAHKRRAALAALVFPLKADTL